VQSSTRRFAMSRNHLGIRRLVAVGLLATSVMALSWAAAGTAATERAKPRCEPGDVDMVLSQGGAGLGHWSETLVLLDVGDRSCSFKGYPTVRAYTSTKHWVTARRTPEGYMGGVGDDRPIVRVPLQFNTVASTLLEGSDMPTGNASTCPTYLRIVVSLPGWPPSANLAFDAPACVRLQVHPIVAGPTGDDPPE
jgi:hypothetical protein